MWRDYFSFNKKQRNGILVLLSIIVLMMAWLVISNHLPPPRGNVNLTAFKNQAGSAPADSSVTPAGANTTRLPIELNGADFTGLENNVQIAPYAKAIISYRNKLGGFTNKKQLLEVQGMDTIHYKVICNCISIDSTKIRKLSLNSASAKELAKQPYIGYFTAQAIVNYRKEHGNYKQIKDLLKNAAIDNLTFNKLAPYLSIN